MGDPNDPLEKYMHTKQACHAASSSQCQFLTESRQLSKPANHERNPSTKVASDNGLETNQGVLSLTEDGSNAGKFIDSERIS